jgi:hypothetical protein
VTVETPFSLESLLTGDTNDWTAGLPNYQRALVEQMLESQSPTEAAITWLTSSGPNDTVPFGGVRVGAGLFYANLLREMQKLFCGGAGYREERAALANMGTTTKLVFVGFVSTAVAPHVGAAAAVLGPAVALVLSIVAKAGVTTICDGLALAIAEQESDRPNPAASGSRTE